ncbi:MAG: tetraacyldisaccharide 4'-kinase [Candidatus Omnitrophota bacterium]
MKNYLYALVTDQRNDFFAQILKLFLFLLSLFYGLIIRVLAFFYSLNPYRAPCKVISVGNITVGGTGKTTLVESIVRFLDKRRGMLTVISRGYKRCATVPGPQDIGSMGDEPDMLRNNLGGIPILANKDRVKAIKFAVNSFKADTVILDDAMQQWRISKDLEIVTIDSGNPFGNKHMLPRGILREPMSALKRADIFVLTKTNLNSGISQIKELLNKINPNALIIESMHLPRDFYNLSDSVINFRSLEELRGKSVILFSGIADPKSFSDLVKSLGVNIISSLVFPDHYNYSKSDISDILKCARSNNVDAIITTQKDAARLKEFKDTMLKPQIIILCIELELKDEQRLFNRLLRIYSA